jgi:WD40 repeat protein
VFSGPDDIVSGDKDQNVKSWNFVTFLAVAVFCLRGDTQNIPDRCRHPYSSCGSAKHLSQQAKLWTPGSTAKFCGDCVKTCEDVAPNFGKNRPGCFTMTTPRRTLPSSASSFWRKYKMAVIPTNRTPLIWHPVTSSSFQKRNLSWKDAGLILLRRPRPYRRKCLTLTEKDLKETF